MEIALLLIMISFQFIPDPACGFFQRPERKGPPNIFNELIPLTEGKPSVGILRPIKPKTKSLREKRKYIMRQMKNVKTVSDLLQVFKPVKGFNVEISGEGKSFYIVNKQRHAGGGLVGAMLKPLKVKYEAPVPAPCVPRPKVRDLSFLSARYNGVVWPNCITYPQCGGCCRQLDVHDCVPRRTHDVMAHLFVIGYDDNKYHPINYTYKHHVDCACGCKVKKHHCVGRQRYDKENCECYCPPEEETKCPGNKQWSKYNCQCTCRNQDTHCSRLKIWNTRACSCMCKERKKCPYGMSWDDASCHCAH